VAGSATPSAGVDRPEAAPFKPARRPPSRLACRRRRNV